MARASPPTLHPLAVGAPAVVPATAQSTPTPLAWKKCLHLKGCLYTMLLERNGVSIGGEVGLWAFNFFWRKIKLAHVKLDSCQLGVHDVWDS